MRSPDSATQTILQLALVGKGTRQLKQEIGWPYSHGQLHLVAAGEANCISVERENELRVLLGLPPDIPDYRLYNPATHRVVKRKTKKPKKPPKRYYRPSLPERFNVLSSKDITHIIDQYLEAYKAYSDDAV